MPTDSNSTSTTGGSAYVYCCFALCWAQLQSRTDLAYLSSAIITAHKQRVFLWGVAPQHGSCLQGVATMLYCHTRP